MEQYFMAVILDRREFIGPLCVSGLIILLRDRGISNQFNEWDFDQLPFLDAIAGRWAGDRISFICTYDEPGTHAFNFDTYTNITSEVVEAWNFIGDILVELRIASGLTHSTHFKLI
jgi:hypothetical protein